MKMPAGHVLFATAFILAVPAFALPSGPLSCEGGMAGPYPCRAVDQAGFVPLDDLSRSPLANAGRVIGWHHEASGREVAVLSLGPEISFVEVTDPEHPEPRGEYRRDGSTAFLGSTAVYGDHLYVSVLDNGAPKLDIIDMTQVLETEGASTRVQAAAIVPAPLYGWISIVPETGHAFLIAGRVVGLDLNPDPEDPEQILSWEPGPPHTSKFECVLYHGPDTRYSGHEVCTAPAPPRSMVLYDVTPEHPAKLSRTYYKRYNSAVHATFTSDHRFVLLSDSHDEFNPGFNTRTFLFNATSLTSPSYFAAYDGPTKARDLYIEVRGRYAFLANVTAGVRVLDLQQIAKGRIREVGFFDMEPSTNSATWSGAHSLDVLPSGIVVVASLKQGLFVLRPRL
jgi:choice-of-anchor B domain-containing protein